MAMEISLVIYLLLAFQPYLIRSNYHLYEVTAFNEHERSQLYQIHVINKGIFFTNGVSNEAAISMNVAVTDQSISTFEKQLNTFGIQYDFVSEIKSDDLLRVQAVNFIPNNNTISHMFYTWEKILNWINNLKSNHDAILKKFVIAKTYHQRDVFVIKLSKNRYKPAIFIVGGEDGIDWIASSVILNLINSFLHKRNEFNILLNNFDFYLLPILNPDGFVYSHEKKIFWSKNRKKILTNAQCAMFKPSDAVGVSLARNWFLQRSKKAAAGECNAIYVGPKALSEGETQGLSYVLNNVALNMIAFVNVRGFGQYISIPYGLKNTQSNNHDIMMEILKSTLTKVNQKHNVTYILGTTSNLFYNFSGNMADWVKSKLNTPVVFTVYLNHEKSFFPKPEHIKTLSEQFFTILNETLLISNKIYGPLFNYQPKLYDNHNFNIYFINMMYCLYKYIHTG